MTRDNKPSFSRGGSKQSHHGCDDVVALLPTFWKKKQPATGSGYLRPSLNTELDGAVLIFVNFHKNMDNLMGC